MANQVAITSVITTAILGILNRVFSFGFFVTAGFTQGFQPVAGFNYGARKIKRLKESIVVTVKRTTFFGVILFILFFFFNEQVIGFFSQDSEVELEKEDSNILHLFVMIQVNIPPLHHNFKDKENNIIFLYDIVNQYMLNYFNLNK